MQRIRIWLLLGASMLAGTWLAGCRAYVDDGDVDSAPDAAVEVETPGSQP